MMRDERISLTNVMRGAVIERFDELFQQLADNIMDPNTKPDARRAITLTMSVKPSASREVAGVEFSVEPKLAPPKAVETTFYIALTKDGPRLSELNARQDELPLDRVARTMRESGIRASFETRDENEE